jgi:hypothetical protein
MAVGRVIRWCASLAAEIWREVAVPAPDPQEPKDPAGTVLLTRRTWDWYFLPTVAIAAVLGMAFARAWGELQPLLWPLSPAFLWLLLRLQTPKGGMRVSRISAVPGTIPMLAWLSLCLLLTAGVTLVDTVWLGNDWRQPLSGYRLCLYLAVLPVSLGGVWFIQRRYGIGKRKAGPV